MKEHILCPACKGAKGWFRRVPIFNSTTKEWETVGRFYKCGRCDGKGWIEIETGDDEDENEHH